LSIHESVMTFGVQAVKRLHGNTGTFTIHAIKQKLKVTNKLIAVYAKKMFGVHVMDHFYTNRLPVGVRKIAVYRYLIQ
jgi:hypothetical protein